MKVSLLTADLLKASINVTFQFLPSALEDGEPDESAEGPVLQATAGRIEAIANLGFHQVRGHVTLKTLMKDQSGAGFLVLDCDDWRFEASEDLVSLSCFCDAPRSQLMLLALVIHNVPFSVC